MWQRPLHCLSLAACGRGPSLGRRKAPTLWPPAWGPDRRVPASRAYDLAAYGLGGRIVFSGTRKAPAKGKRTSLPETHTHTTASARD